MTNTEPILSGITIDGHAFTAEASDGLLFVAGDVSLFNVVCDYIGDRLDRTVAVSHRGHELTAGERARITALAVRDMCLLEEDIDVTPYGVVATWDPALPNTAVSAGNVADLAEGLLARLRDTSTHTGLLEAIGAVLGPDRY